LHGNVAEWTLDHYAADYYSTHTDKVVRSPWNRPVALYDRVYRGGSWDDDPEDLRSAARIKSGMFLQKDDPQVPKSFWWYTNSSHIGFRRVSPVNMPSSEELRKFWATVLDENQ